jgi:ankyrin repeat protein
MGLIVAGIAPLQGMAVSGRSSEAGRVQQNAGIDVGPRALGVALVDAAEHGSLAEVTALLNRGADVNSVVLRDGSPLIVAARRGRAEIVRALLESGADPDLGVEGDGSALIVAAREGHLNVVRMLLDRGASVELIVEGDENALIQASGRGHVEVVKLLVTRGANINARAWAPSAAGRSAAEEFRTPLSMARRNGRDVVAKYLLSLGAIE